MNETEIFIKHKDWNGYCIIDNNSNKIIRKECEDEIGSYIKNKNKLIIKWIKWNEEKFYYYNNDKYYYCINIFEENFMMLSIFHKEKIYDLVLNKNNNEFVMYENKNKLIGSYIKNNDLIILEYEEDNFNNINKVKIVLKNITDNIYCYIEDFYNNTFFDLNINNNLINEKYFFNKITKKFYNTSDLDNNGIYEIIDNCLIMEWKNGDKKKFYSNKYICNDKINENLNIIKPINIFIDGKVLFSNISLCKNKIILTSMHYKYNNWDLSSLDLNISNINIIKTTILDNDDKYEGSTVIILELDRIVNNLFLKINYKKLYVYNIYLEQLNIVEHKFSLVTVFKDDYLLLKRFLKYYSDLGINIFFLYYNKKIDNNIIEEIIKLNERNLIIYLIEWDYVYWWEDKNNPKYHCAQLMAINDSLHILKNYGDYILYNDLDEYIDNNFNNFNKLIYDNDNVDIFIFKNRFCKMGKDLIKFKNFDKYFDLKKVIEGNYYDEYREKNLIKSDKINVMGVHKVFKSFSKLELEEKIISQFYHFINFEEKNRENLMIEYIY